MKIFLCVLLTSLALGSFRSHAQMPEQTKQIIPLEDFVKLALTADTEFEQILLEALRLNYSRDLKLPARDLIFSVRQEYDVFIDGTNGWATSVGLDKLFPLTGTSLSASYTVEPSRYGGREESGSVSLTLSQSIARNAFGRSTRLLDRIIGVETNVAQHQIIEAYEDYLASVISAYDDWSSAYENLKVGRASYEENLKLLDNIRERQEKQIAKAVDVNKITLQVVGRKESLIELEESFFQKQAVICRLLRRNAVNDLVPDARIRNVLENGKFSEHFDNFCANGRTFRILELLEKRSQIQVDREADDLLPSVDLKLGLEVDGDGRRLSDQEEMVFAGIELKWPFFSQKEEAELNNARIDLRAAELRKANVRYRLFSDLLTLFHELEKTRRLIDVAKEKIKLADDIVRDEKENYSFGRVTLNDYIQAVNGRDAARFNQIRHETQYRHLLTEWRRLTDTLVSPKDISRPAAYEREK